MFEKAYIPYKGYYSSPFCKWQNSLANENSIVLGAHTSKRWFKSKNIDPKMFDYLFLGISVGQFSIFYGSTWAASMMGAGHMPGVIIMDACATSTTTIYNAALGVENGFISTPYCLMVDRTSNGPHTVWPHALGSGGEVISENWTLNSFNRDPSTGQAMIVTAENVAKEAGFTKEQCDALTLRRYEQYQDALAKDRAFQKRYIFPVEAQFSKKDMILVEKDEGVQVCTREGLARLKPTIEGGVHSFGSQTCPADGNVGIIVSTREKCKELSTDPKIEVKIISYGFTRVKKAFMPSAVVPAVKMALKNANIDIKDVKTIKSHNPFAANDLYFSKEMNIDINSFNNYGSSLIFGHPQAPTVGRLIIEGIEETVMKGGGYLVAGGCAAGDIGAALVLKVE